MKVRDSDVLAWVRGKKEDKYWARLGCWISPCYSPFLLGARFDTYELFIFLIFSGPQQTTVTETVDTESAYTGA
jgi:hypothetical protein